MDSKKLVDNVIYTIKAHFEESRVKTNIDKDVDVIDERSFLALRKEYQKYYDRFSNTIFVVVNFEKGTIKPDCILQPATLICYSETESFDKARTLLNDFATRFNFALSNGINGDIFLQEVYTTSSVEEPFEEEGDNFRAILSINATYVYSENMSNITKITVNNNDISFVSVNYSAPISPNTANIGNNNGRTTTQNKFISFSITFSFPSRSNDYLTSVCDGVALGTTDINTEYVFKIYKGSSTNYYEKTLKITGIEYEQVMGEIPFYSVSFGA